MLLSHAFEPMYIVPDKKAGKFKEWLDVSSLIEVKPSGAVMEILSYMAYETVGQVKSNFLCFIFLARIHYRQKAFISFTFGLKRALNRV